MAFGKIGQTLTAVQIFDLVRSDLDKVEKKTPAELQASVEGAVTSLTDALKTAPADVITAIHLCRGNASSGGIASSSSRRP